MLSGFIHLRLCLFSPGQVFRDVYSKLFKVAHPLHWGPVNHEWGVGPLLTLQSAPWFLVVGEEAQSSGHNPVGLELEVSWHTHTVCMWSAYEELINPVAKGGIQSEITEFGGQPAGDSCIEAELINRSLVGLCFCECG